MALYTTQVLIPSKGYVWQCTRCGEIFSMRNDADRHATMWLKNCPAKDYQ